MKELTVPAKTDRLDQVMEFIEEELNKTECSAKVIMQIKVAVEEIYVNIANYAYHPGEGNATIRCLIQGDPKHVVIQFVDSGTPYNPLEKMDPDITQDANHRQIGGLGILMVKKMMDHITYRHEGEKNILTLKKNI